MRNNLTQSQIFSKPSSYYAYMLDHRYNILSVETMGPEKIRVYYTMKDEYVTENWTSNIVVALWTTAVARLRLFEFMKMVDIHPGSKLYYTDTDSIVFSHPVNDCPVPIGNKLGDMSDELPGKKMTEFYCAGNKQYAYKYVEEKTGQESTKLKLRGITLDYATIQHINYDNFKRQVEAFGKMPAQTTYTRFKINRDSRITTVKMPKQYNPIFKKGCIDSDLNVYPFGF